jgi:hypothetical protein
VERGAGADEEERGGRGEWWCWRAGLGVEAEASGYIRRGGGGGAAGEAGGGAERSRFVEGKDWNGGTHGLGCKIGKLLEQFVFWG